MVAEHAFWHRLREPTLKLCRLIHICYTRDSAHASYSNAHRDELQQDSRMTACKIARVAMRPHHGILCSIVIVTLDSICIRQPL